MTARVQDRLVDVDAVQAPAAARAPVGAGKTFRAYDPDQVLLMSPAMSDYSTSSASYHHLVISMSLPSRSR